MQIDISMRSLAQKISDMPLRSKQLLLTQAMQKKFIKE